MGKEINLSGQRFSRLLVIERLPGSRWQCICDCGKTTVTKTNRLTSGKTNSCGCYMKDMLSGAKKTHGLTKTPIYSCWANMKRRCQLVTHPWYKRYGGRGIQVCERWNSFENFRTDMAATYFKAATLERVNVHGNYCPENCIWIEKKEQQKNRSNTLRYEYNGQMLSLVEIASIIGVKYMTLRHRIKTSKWPLDIAFSTQTLMPSEFHNHRL